MTQPSRGDIFKEAKISVHPEPQSLIHAPHTFPLNKPHHAHSNHHHNSNNRPPQSHNHVQHRAKPQSHPYRNGVSSKRPRRIRLIIPRKRKLHEMQSKSKSTHSTSSDSKENKENHTQKQPPQKKPRLSPLKPKTLPPIQHKKQHKHQSPPITSFVAPSVPIKNDNVHKGTKNKEIHIQQQPPRKKPRLSPVKTKALPPIQPQKQHKHQPPPINTSFVAQSTSIKNGNLHKETENKENPRLSPVKSSLVSITKTSSPPLESQRQHKPQPPPNTSCTAQSTPIKNDNVHKDTVNHTRPPPLNKPRLSPVNPKSLLPPPPPFNTSLIAQYTPIKNGNVNKETATVTTLPPPINTSFAQSTPIKNGNLHKDTENKENHIQLQKKQRLSPVKSSLVSITKTSSPPLQSQREYKPQRQHKPQPPPNTPYTAQSTPKDTVNHSRPPPLNKPPLYPKSLLPPPPPLHTSLIAQYTPIKNGHVNKETATITTLPPPPPLQSISPPPPSNNPYLYLQSQLNTHYHWPSHNRSGARYSHICNECGQGFMSGNALGGHKGQHKRAKERAIRRSITQQHYRDNQYYYPDNYASHPLERNGDNGVYVEKKKRRRNIDLHNKRDVNGNFPSHDKDGNAYTHFCHVCGKGFSTTSALGGHRSVHKRMERMGKPYNKLTGKHEDINAPKHHKDIVMEDMERYRVHNVPPPISPTAHYAIMDEKEYKEYEGLENKEIMYKIIDKLNEMDEDHLFRADDTSVEYKMKVTECLSFEIIKNKIAENKYASVQPEFMADINKLFRFVFKVYKKSDLRYKWALKLKQFAYRQCMAALGSPASSSSSSLLSTSSRNEYQRNPDAYQLECLPNEGYDEISDYEFFCDEKVLKDKMSCKKKVSCSGECCNDLNNLGPYCLSSEQWKSSCLCRSKQMECSDDCKCDPLKCKNRSIQNNLYCKTVREQEVFGIDQHTRMCIEKALPKEIKDVYTDCDNAKTYFIESLLCVAINNFSLFVLSHPEYKSKYDPAMQNKANESEAPFMITDVLRTMLYTAEQENNDGSRRVIEYMLCLILDMATDQLKTDISGIERSKRRMRYNEFVLFGVDFYLNDSLFIGGCDMICHFEFPIYSKGMGVICINKDGIKANEYIISFLGVVYSPWCWYEKDDRTRWLIKSRGAPKQAEFFNIMMEKHRDDVDGYDLVFIDPSLKGNYGSRLSHSCSPNCISVSMGVNSKYNIAVYAKNDIKYGEELCFNYNSVTESEKEWRDAVCLCGSSCCNGQFLIYAGTMLYTQVMKKAHHLLHRTAMLFNANIGNSALENGILSRYNLGSSSLSGIPLWIKKYAVSILKYIDYEQCSLPKELRAAALRGEKGYDSFIAVSAAEEESIGLKYVRLSNLVITLNKIALFFRHPPNKTLMELPLFKMFSAKQLIDKIWFNSNSIISQLFVFIALFEGENHYILQRINSIRKILNNDSNIRESRKYLLEIRSLLIKLPPRNGAYHHSAADILLMYASTTYFFSFYPPFQGFQSRVFTYNELGYNSRNEYHKYAPPKKYGQQYVWGQLNYWERHSIESPDSSLSAERRGTICLPNIKCCYKNKRAYSYNVRKQFINHLINKHWTPWSSKWHFAFKNGGIYGSPWLDLYIDPNNEKEKFNKFIQTMKDTKMIYVDGSFTKIEDDIIIDDDDDDDYKKQETNNKNVKKEKEKDNNNNNNDIGKATRRSNRLRTKQIPSYIEPKIAL